MGISSSRAWVTCRCSAATLRAPSVAGAESTDSILFLLLQALQSTELTVLRECPVSSHWLRSIFSSMDCISGEQPQQANGKVCAKHVHGLRRIFFYLFTIVFQALAPAFLTSTTCRVPFL